MQLPEPRGPLSQLLREVLAGTTEPDQAALTALAGRTAAADDPLTDEDLQLSLWLLYELHYRGFDGVDDDLEWEPALLAVRQVLERSFETALRAACEPTVAAHRARLADPSRRAGGADAVAEELFALVDGFEGPSLARHLQREATAEQFTEVLVHRSIYQLKEADPHSWAIPRLPDRAKVALVEVQFDEYGAGRPERQHARLFGDGLEACGLDRRYGGYLDAVPAVTLALNNAMSLLGLHRRLRGAAMGHLAALEATSSLPCRKYVGGVRRLGLPEAVAVYFDEHVEADAVHEQVAARDICGTLAVEDPALVEDILFGATVCLLTDARLAEHVVGCWQRGLGSLRGTGSGAEAVA